MRQICSASCSMFEQHNTEFIILILHLLFLSCVIIKSVWYALHFEYSWCTKLFYKILGIPENSLEQFPGILGNSREPKYDKLLGKFPGILRREFSRIPRNRVFLIRRTIPKNSQFLGITGSKVKVRQAEGPGIGLTQSLSWTNQHQKSNSKTSKIGTWFENLSLYFISQ